MVIEGSIVEERPRGGQARPSSPAPPATPPGPKPSPAAPAREDRPATVEDLLKAKRPAEPAQPPADAAVPGPFKPANGVEENLLEAASQRRTDRFLSTLLLAKVLVPAWQPDTPPERQQWATNEVEGSDHLVTYTSIERMVERLGPGANGAWVRFTALISVWPGAHLSFAVNPDSPVGATLPGDEIVALASWATKMGLTDPEPDPVPTPDVKSSPADDEPLVMQKAVSPQQVALYLERGYDRASGFVHRASEVDHLGTPRQIYAALGLGYSGSTFDPNASEVYLLRWRAYHGSLYRIPYGGNNEAARREADGWVIERAPFRGDGRAPSETGDAITEFKVDSVRLPHGAQLWRLNADGDERLVALLDADGPRWRLVGA